MRRGYRIAVLACMLLSGTAVRGQEPADSVTTETASVDCIAREIVSYARATEEPGREPQQLATHLLWEMPAATAAWGLAAVAGTSQFYLDATQKANKLIREEFQLWRREHTENQVLTFDNYIQYLTLFAGVGLKLAGVESDHNLWQMAMISTEGFLLSSAIVYPLKHIVTEWRPDRGSSTSFPSGHTATAFCGAELLRLEYGKQSGWIAAAGYTVAAATGVMRIYNDRHWTGDVISGACIGVLAADLTYWINKKIEQHRQVKQHSVQNETGALPYLL